MRDDTGNFADRTAEAAMLSELLAQPWMRRLRAVMAARQYADEHGLELTKALRQGIFDVRREMRELGFPEEVIDATPGLELPEGDEQ
ncbi:hypothetical protein [Mycobacterium sp.]|uniref:hypothetical protein n=1 Tax=Mycobacterium sp. TaxID=1785 RepID=UPI003F98F5CA